jgi:hypothetical protein
MTQMLQDVFGFSKETALDMQELMILMKIAHIGESEEEVALHLMILFGSTYYGDTEGIISKNFLWDGTVGKNVFSKDEFAMKLTALGFSEVKTNNLYAKIREQHEISSQSSTKFNDKPDFAHMMITGAAELSNSPQILASIAARGRAVKAAGWLGDVSIVVPLTTPSMGNDDYKADLDAVNIVRRIQHGSGSFSDTVRHYYNELDRGKTNRAKEFKTHYKVDDIIAEINQVDGSGKQVGAKAVMGGKETIIEYDYSLKETLNSTAKDFVHSLEQNSNDYIKEASR